MDRHGAHRAGTHACPSRMRRSGDDGAAALGGPGEDGRPAHYPRKHVWVHRICVTCLPHRTLTVYEAAVESRVECGRQPGMMDEGRIVV